MSFVLRFPRHDKCPADDEVSYVEGLIYVWVSRQTCGN